MRKTIWKFPLSITGEQNVNMPRGAEMLHVAMQGGACFLWAMVDPRQELHARPVRMYGTGHPMSDEPGRYLGTFMMHGGALVFHVFDPTPPNS